ncbi:MAG: protein-L-isoaspartate(D-aspartate) O-methyltransferase [Kiritimatiellaeota bacterium]|nr:protein-L-isoaspartate(D-aspartate) O-methyltransferase [Kiritimatiellota bacterium]
MAGLDREDRRLEDGALPEDPPEARALRERMVATQIRDRGLRDPRVLAAFLHVPRHLFCSPGTRLSTAYADHPLPIERGQTISQPFIVAEMTAKLDLHPEAHVLEVGTGSGYQAAILGCLAAEVYSIERIPELALRARERLARLGFANVTVLVGDGAEGVPARGPFDGIVVTAAAPDTPEPLKQQLAEGGRLVIPVGPRHVQELLVWERHGDRFDLRRVGGCRFVPLIGPHGWRG